MTEADAAITDEGDQEMATRDVAGGVEVLRERGSVLRLSEAEVAAIADDDTPSTRPPPRS